MLRLLALIACLTASFGWAAGPLDALRSNSRALRDAVTTLRADQLKGRNELSTLSARIETLKAQQTGKLLPGGELDSALKRSQELSGTLSGLSAQLTARESELSSANLALIDALSAELSRQRADFDRQTNRDARRALIASMRALRAERDALRAAVPEAKLPTLDTNASSDDPEELLERADLLRDSEEKLARQLKQLETRITERREEQELDARVQRFMGEESMFDDADRRLRVQRTTTTPLSETPGRGGQQNPAGAFGGSAPPATTDTQVGTGGVANSPSDAVNLGAAAGAPEQTNTGGTDVRYTGSADSASISVTRASDARLQMGSLERFELDSSDLKALERQRAELEKLKAGLSKKAAELESRAAQLK